jgi:hypothetical protein
LAFAPVSGVLDGEHLRMSDAGSGLGVPG